MINGNCNGCDAITVVSVTVFLTCDATNEALALASYLCEAAKHGLSLEDVGPGDMDDAVTFSGPESKIRKALAEWKRGPEQGYVWNRIDGLGFSLLELEG